MAAALRVNELRVYAHSIAASLHASFERIAHVQLAPGPGDIDGFPPIGERGVPRDDERAPNPRQIGRQALGHAVDEIVLLRVAADIHERKHDDGEAWRRGFGRRRVMRARKTVSLDADGIDMHRPGDVLERLLPEVDELRLDPPAHVLIRGARNGHVARFRDALEAGGDVDAVAKDIVALDQYVAEMDADPVEDALRLGDAFIAGRHLPLHRERALDRLDDGRKVDEHPVAHGLEQPPAMRGDDRLNGLAPLAHRIRRPRLVLPHHARIADNVGGEDGGELAGGVHPADVTVSAARIAGRPCPRARSSRGGSLSGSPGPRCARTIRRNCRRA